MKNILNFHNTFENVERKKNVHKICNQEKKSWIESSKNDEIHFSVEKCGNNLHTWAYLATYFFIMNDKICLKPK